MSEILLVKEFECGFVILLIWRIVLGCAKCDTSSDGSGAGSSLLSAGFSLLCCHVRGTGARFKNGEQNVASSVQQPLES